ncbi:MAG: sel1 repeat family protein [Proteobacteria bacterium]|nr:sel1 repeat family protein [Pseudomonadota bacterium]
MKNVLRSCMTATCIFLCVAGSVLAAGIDDPQMQRTMRAMANADTDWHPDLAGEFNGLRDYAKGRFKAAMQQFLSGAYYSDKLSQMCIGLMYLNGDGVKQDSVTAYAWVALAAERNYGDYVATRDRIKASLTPEQTRQAEAQYHKLAGVYADAIAKPRLVVQLRQGQMRLTGSRTGYQQSMWNAFYVPGITGDAGDAMVKGARCAGPTITLGYQDAPITGCGGDALYAKTFWQPKKYFASRDALWTQVTVGPMIEEKPDSSHPSNR